MPTIAAALTAAALRLADAKLDAGGAAPPRREAELLLCAAAGVVRATLIAWPDRDLTLEQAARFEAWVTRRVSGEPIAYILGRCAFHGLELAVTPATLIPRPETELLVDWALEALPADRPLRCADLGTGSGAIAAALAHARPEWDIFAVDRSFEAVAVAAANARAYELRNLLPTCGSWLSAIAADSLDVIVANPPYVPAGDPHLFRGDLRFEPMSALASGPEGLDAIRLIIEDSRRCLRTGGSLAIEHGWDQADDVRTLLAAAGYDGISIQRDLCGHPRMATASYPSKGIASRPGA